MGLALTPDFTGGFARCCAPLAGGATPALAASAARWRPASTILSSGRYSTLLPALLPTYTFVVFE
ncbi:hflC domain protein [Burkholderia mallei]|nr:hflC domain protein [Burkholderia mallei]